MLILAIDTSTSTISVALLGGDDDPSSPTAARDVHEGRRPAELLAPTIKAVLAEAGAVPGDLTAVAAGVGPGPYTGLRAGLVTARALAHVVGVGVVGVCGLDALHAAAAAGGGPEDAIVATDARRTEVYWARYRSGRRLGEPQVGRPGTLPVEGLVVLGRGALLYPEHLGTPPSGLPLDPPAAWVAALARDTLAGAGPQSLPAEPMYLRRPDAREPGAPEPVGG